ncbi:TetR/AcrR family transcriptional regulator C-terminal domain-containing protein [Devosia aquimaris]|uniref:TetR/AcrR family transcriptional regulator C-terminal domain-containing protein n=1 Tax=Devosia aquimaris TaxID=2866214 RepID=UPI001CD12005|nr:TetR/AcrR family transcriptional regulator C-terminal domain-containing protein [Devosia sp. CJK-A8-3]
MAIDRDHIVDEALSLLNEVGIDKLTTRKLAERLGVAQPALYWHFGNKSALLDAMNSAMLARYHTHRLPQPGEDWIAFTLANARSMRHTLLSVRDGARLTAGTRPSTPDFADTEQVLRLYVDAGFTAEEALNIALSMARYVVGYVLEEQGERARNEQDTADASTFDEDLAEFPLLRRAAQSLLQTGTINTEKAFESGLRYFIDGIAQSLRARTQQN